MSRNKNENLEKMGRKNPKEESHPSIPACQPRVFGEAFWKDWADSCMRLYEPEPEFDPFSDLALLKGPYGYIRH
jgi:hypothetical protein